MKKICLKTKIFILLLVGIIFVSTFYLLKKTKNFIKYRPMEEKGVELAEINNQKIVKEDKTKLVEEKQEKVISIMQNKDIAKAVRQTVAEVGGIKLPKLDSVVLIKPNVNSNGKYPATTNPVVIKTLIEMCYKAGAKKVIVADSSGVGWPYTLKNMGQAGIKQVAQEAGAEVIDLEQKGWFKIKPENSKYWPNGFSFSRIVQEVDYIISAPIIKTHTTTGITLSLKNTVGLLHRADRLKMHASKNIQEMIAEINLAYKPDLIVFDGSKSFITRGPAIGKEVTGNYVIASYESLTADVAAYNILKELGAKLEGNGLNHPMLRHAFQLNFPYTES